MNKMSFDSSAQNEKQSSTNIFNAFRAFRLRKRLVIKEFKNDAEIEALQANLKYKFKGRNVLGVRQIEDWINNLEIGNVMSLNPMNPHELT